jgi:hypothetical protein
MHGPVYGKYRGVVTDNRDPLMQGRIRAQVADVWGDANGDWALPAIPFGAGGERECEGCDVDQTARLSSRLVIGVRARIVEIATARGCRR